MMSGSGLEEETAESILDQHCSRIWASSHHTPSRSPGRQSPHNKSPDRSFARPKTKLGQQSISTTTAVNASFSRIHRSKKDFTLSKSFDSGMGDDKTTVVRPEMHRHIHYHHYHHHSREISSKQRLELEVQQNSSYWREGSTNFDHGRGRTNTKKSNMRKSSDAGSNIDSGISTFDSESTRIVPNWSNPSSEK